MSESDEKKFFHRLSCYKSDIESLRPIKRPMLLWSVVSLVYVCGRLQLKGSEVALWGVEIAGISGGKFTVFLFLATLYYGIKWCWSIFLKRRFYEREGFMSDLRQYRRDPRRIKEIREELDMDTAFYGKDSGQFTDNDKDLSDTVFSSRFVINLELIFVPYILPIVVFCSALVALLVAILYRLLAPYFGA